MMSASKNKLYFQWEPLKRPTSKISIPLLHMPPISPRWNSTLPHLSQVKLHSQHCTQPTHLFWKPSSLMQPLAPRLCLFLSLSLSLSEDRAPLHPRRRANRRPEPSRSLVSPCERTPAVAAGQCGGRGGGPEAAAGLAPRGGRRACSWRRVGRSAGEGE